MIETPPPELLALTSNLQLVDEMYARYRVNPADVDAGWRRLFSTRGPQDGDGGLAETPTLSAGSPALAETPTLRASQPEPGNGNGRALPAPPPGALPAVPSRAVSSVEAARSAAAGRMVLAYRVRGHLEANLDPLGALQRAGHPDLDPRSYGFTHADGDVLVNPDGVLDSPPLRLGALVERMRATYCGTVGVEYMHITRPERRRWLQQRMESPLGRPSIPSAVRKLILDQLVRATELERFLDAKYVGSKRFSLEGSETLIPLLHTLLERAGDHGVDEAVLGMAHRGRLNVLVNLMQMSAATLFAEFEDIDPQSTLGGGDVKYHLGFSTDYVTRPGRNIHLSLSFNPSHLEAVDPVVIGRVRAKQRRRRDVLHQKVLGILIHGDAAFAGQGLVSEVLNQSDLHGYRTGGTVHVIVNNQIGFTTSPTEARSTPYCTDVAKMTQIPIFHVNGDDPDAVAQVAMLAMDYRKEFSSDVVIDMFCFRRHGHNEMDEPSFTQPLLYERIKRHADVYQIYAERLAAEGVIAPPAAGELVAAQHGRLSADLARARATSERPAIETLHGVWVGYLGGPEATVPDVDTGVARDRLAHVAATIATIPAGFQAHPKLVRLADQRAAMGRGERPLDWAMAELIAFGSLIDEGTLVRLSGQDSRRGTFSQRHAVIVDITNGDEYTPLHHLGERQGEFRIYDSSLSEAGVLGFEFGYSLDYPDGLVMWEAQFGDFANGAQVILDQFVSASEDRWKRLSGVVLLLPHGFEGQGPEHSSARFERYLQLCAEDNWQVTQPTTPAQYFHLLRRQVLRRWRKPLVVLTPKSMLRLPAATSPLEALTAGRFQRILDDPTPPGTQGAALERVVLCTGKLYYELAEERRRRTDPRTAIVRVEQLYPFAEEELRRVLDGYPHARELIWAQEEPANMGARTFMLPRLHSLAAGRDVRAVARPESASPATGSAKAHALEQRTILDEVFAPGIPHV